MPAAPPPSRARALRRALATVALIALAGCGGAKKTQPTPTATPKPPTDRELIGRLLERRAAALRTDRAAAFVATSLPARADAAREAARRIKGLGLEHPRYRIERVRIHGRRARIRARLPRQFQPRRTHAEGFELRRLSHREGGRGTGPSSLDSTAADAPRERAGAELHELPQRQARLRRRRFFGLQKVPSREHMALLS